MTVEERLKTLEREQGETNAELGRAKRRVRRLLIAGAFALACFAVLLAVWACMPEAHAQARARVLQEVRARNFVLVDEKGKRRAGLGIDKDGVVGLGLYDENGELRVALCLGEDPGLTLSDENGQTRAGLGLSEDGPMLILLGRRGKPRASLSVSKRGAARAGLCLTDANDKPRATLGLSEDGPVLGLLDENGNAIWKAP